MLISLLPILYISVSATCPTPSVVAVFVTNLGVIFLIVLVAIIMALVGQSELSPIIEISYSKRLKYFHQENEQSDASFSFGLAKVLNQSSRVVVRNSRFFQ